MKVLFLLSFFIVSTNILFGQDTLKTKKVKELLKITEVDKLGQQMINSIFTLYKNKYKTLSLTQLNDLKAEIKADKLIDIVAKIYDRYYTEVEIDQLIIFYSSSVGKKVIRVTPSIMNESAIAGQIWGTDIDILIDKMIKDRKFITQL